MSEQRGTKAEIRNLRMSLGLCVDCGGPIEAQTRGYKLPPIRCAACRERETQRKYAIKRIHAEQEAKREEEERRTHAYYRPPKAICESCVWATFAGSGVWFCPLAVCKLVRERKEEENANFELHHAD